MRIDRTHKRWLLATLAALLLATAVYVPYHLSDAGPRGGSRIGIGFGVLGYALMVFAGLLGARKKVPVWRLGRAQTWMRGHLWLGILSLPLILFHAGFASGGTLAGVALVLLVVVVASGVAGATLQHFLPRIMTARLPLETIYQEIASVRGRLCDEADARVAAVVAEGQALVRHAADGALALCRVEGDDHTAELERLRRFHAAELRPYLHDPARGDSPLAGRTHAREAFDRLRAALPRELQPAIDDLEDICEEGRQLALQTRLHHWLHAWLLIHVPLSLALLVLGAVHAVMALSF